MNLPISMTLMLACLAAFRMLFFIISGLFFLLAVRSIVDQDLAISWSTASLGAVGFWIAGRFAGMARTALANRRWQKRT